MIHPLPDPPYFAVYFLSHRRAGDQGYQAMAEKMEQLAAEQPGFLGMESLRQADGWGMTVSYWESEEDIRAWKDQLDHVEAQRKGRSDWYDQYVVRVCRVERSYGFSGKA